MVVQKLISWNAGPASMSDWNNVLNAAGRTGVIAGQEFGDRSAFLDRALARGFHVIKGDGRPGQASTPLIVGANVEILDRLYVLCLPSADYGAGAGPDETKTKWIIGALLRVNGVVFGAASTHLVASQQNNQRELAARTHVNAIVAALDGREAPWFVLGDFNATPEDPNNALSGLYRAGWTNNHRQGGTLATHGNRAIDMVWWDGSPRVKFMSQRAVNNGSDHDMLLVQVSVVGAGQTATIPVTASAAGPRGSSGGGSAGSGGSSDRGPDVLQFVVGGRKGARADILAAVTGSPTLSRTIDGASTLEVPLADFHRDLVLDTRINERSWARVNGVTYELVQLRKSGDILNLVFEDSIAAALRRQTSRLSIPAGAITRAQFLLKLAREPRATIPVAVDPSDRGTVQRVLQRSVGEVSDSWTVSGEVAEEVQWRRISTGSMLLAGSDDWLMHRTAPVVLREHTGGVASSIDFDLDAGKRSSEASFTVDTTLFGLPPGSPVKLDRMGPADGLWLVAEVSRTLASTRANVRLVRGRHALKEPKREATTGDPGDPDAIGGQGGSDTGGAVDNPARGRMVDFALAQAGDSYVWGAHGPDAWDCSGLVQSATAAGGRTLAAPSASQWATCVSQGKTISVATALKTRGALLFRIDVSTYNHVAISLGNGSTMEARGSAYGTGVFSGAADGGWTGAALWL